jgi:hypothetical protein
MGPLYSKNAMAHINDMEILMRGPDLHIAANYISQEERKYYKGH